MTDAASANPRRYLAIWFPWLPSDRLRRQERADAASPEGEAPRPPLPLVLIEKVKGGWTDFDAAVAGTEWQRVEQRCRCVLGEQQDFARRDVHRIAHVMSRVRRDRGTAGEVILNKAIFGGAAEPWALRWRSTLARMRGRENESGEATRTSSIFMKSDPSLPMHEAGAFRRSGRRAPSEPQRSVRREAARGVPSGGADDAARSRRPRARGYDAACRGRLGSGPMR